MSNAIGTCKAALKRIGWIHDLNAASKARATRRRYADTLSHYRGMAQEGPPPIPPRLPERDRGRPLRIFFLGTDEQQDRSGTLQALERLGSLRCFTRADGSYGQNDPRTGEARRRANSERLWELVSTAAESGEAPDVLIAQTWATLIDPSVLKRIRSTFGSLVVNVAMDDRHQYWGERRGEEWMGTRGLVSAIDLALTAAPECLDWYRKEGCPALFFPEASDPEIFRPCPDLPKIHDVCFVGGRYGIRREIVEALRQAGIRVAAFGDGWEAGRIATQDMPALFAQSRIVLGIGTIGHCRDFYALKLRDFDAPMSGSLYLTHDNPDLAGLFEIGAEIATYRDAEDCVAKVRYYLSRESEREAIAAAGRERAARDHTWDSRFGGLLAVLEGREQNIVGLPGASAP